MMIIDRSPANRRQGGIKGLLGVLILFGAFIAGFYLNGSLNQQRQETLLGNGYAMFNQGDHAGAFKNFSEAKKTFSLTLSFFRLLKRADNFVTRAELSDLIISTCLSASYDSFFILEPTTEWTQKASEELSQISDANRKEEYKKLIDTAVDISGLCKDFSAGEVEKALKELKNVEGRALSADQDFFIFEIRFLIACGKALNEPAILGQARELLFFATTDAGINNERTQKLWGILTN